MKLAKSVFMVTFTYLLSAVLARAETPASACRSVADLNKEVSDCAGNEKYREAANGCVQGFQAFQLPERKIALKELASLGTIRVDAMFNGRAPSITSIEDRFANAKQVLEKVLAQGEKTTDSVHEYLSNIVYPEDWDAPATVIGDANKFFDAHKCYSANRDRLESMIDEVSESTTQIRQAMSAAELRVALFRDLRVGLRN